MGQSSLAREIGRELVAEKGDAWSYVFVDIQSCSSGAEWVARLAEEIHKHPDFPNTMNSWLKRLFNLLDNIEEVSVGEFAIKLRSYLIAGN